jgi:hypothetical protein
MVRRGEHDEAITRLKFSIERKFFIKISVLTPELGSRKELCGTDDLDDFLARLSMWTTANWNRRHDGRDLLGYFQ